MANAELMEGKPPVAVAPGGGLLDWRYVRYRFAHSPLALLGLALGRATNNGKPLGHERRVLARIRAEATAIDTGRDEFPLAGFERDRNGGATGSLLQPRQRGASEPHSHWSGA